jgi:hypothetical protein
MNPRSFPEARAQKGIAGHTPRNKNRVNSRGVRGRQGALEEVTDDGVLEAGDKIKCLLRAMSTQRICTGTFEGLAPGTPLLGLDGERSAADLVENGGLEP